MGYFRVLRILKGFAIFLNVCCLCSRPEIAIRLEIGLWSSRIRFVFNKPTQLRMLGRERIYGAFGVCDIKWKTLNFRAPLCLQFYPLARPHTHTLLPRVYIYVTNSSVYLCAIVAERAASRS